MKNTWKLIFLATLSSIAVGTFLPTIASAHQMKYDGSIGALLHVDPNDDPYVNETTFMHVEFRDKEHYFRADQCLCTITLTEGSRSRFAASTQSPPAALERSQSTLGFEYVFPEKGIYTLTVHGEPQAGALFKPFTLSYDIRVANDRGSFSPSLLSTSDLSHFFIHHGHHLIIYSIGFSVGLLLVLRDRKKLK
jgi:hypothetical protein